MTLLTHCVLGCGAAPRVPAPIHQQLYSEVPGHCRQILTEQARQTGKTGVIQLGEV